MADAAFLVDLSEAELHARDAQLASHRLTSLAVYGSVAAPRFAAIWHTDEEVGARKIVVSPPLALDDIGSVRAVVSGLNNALAVENFSAVLVSATGEVGPGAAPGLRVALVGERRAIDPQAEVLVSETIDGLRKDRPDTPVSMDTCFSASATAPWPAAPPPPRAHHFAIFHGARGSSRTVWNYLAPTVYDLADGIDLSPIHHAVLKGWSRAHQAVPAPAKLDGLSRQAFVHYRDDTYARWPAQMLDPFDGGTPVSGPLRRSELDGIVADRLDEGLWPLTVGANGRGANTRFCVTFAPVGRVRALKRQFIVSAPNARGPARVPTSTETEPAPLTLHKYFPKKWQSGGSTFKGSPLGSSGAAPAPSQQDDPPPYASVLAKIDQKVFNAMKASGAHASQIAVAKNGRLKVARAYTWAESNYPVTRLEDKLRWASVSKMLLGLRVAAMSDPEFLSMSLPTVFDYEADADFPAATLQRRARFASTRVVDLLHHAAGWRTDRGTGNYGYHNAFFTHGRQALPLVPGDFRRFVRGSQLDFVSSEPGALGDPGEIFRYNNAHFIAASEAVSWRLSNRKYDEYAARMEDWWSPAIGRNVAIAIPETQDLSLQNGEAPLRGTPGHARTTIVNEGVLPPALVHGWVPHAYGGGADLKVLASGFYSMSAAAMARILQGMHPNADPAANLLSWEQVLSLRDAVALQKLNAEGQYEARIEGLSLGVETLDFAGVTMFKFAHSGSFSSGPGAVAIHLAREDDGLITSISWCGASTVDGGVSVVGLQSELEALQALGYLDDERDLFPDLLEI